MRPGHRVDELYGIVDVEPGYKVLQVFKDVPYSLLVVDETLDNADHGPLQIIVILDVSNHGAVILVISVG